jgi:hypothetical protein
LQHTIHKRTQLDEETQQRKPENKYKTGNFHHQNPFVLRTLIDQEHKKSMNAKQGMANRKRSSSNFARDQVQTGGHTSRPANPNDKPGSIKQKSTSANGNFYYSTI